MEQQLFPTLLPAIAQLLKTVDSASIVPTAGVKPMPIWARPTSAHPGMIKSRVPQRDRPNSAPAYMDKRHFEPLHWLAAYLMRHNPRPRYHSWTEKQAADERAAQEAKVREEAELTARVKMAEEMARKAEEERQERQRLEEEERRKEEERLEAERKKEEEERAKAQEELRLMAEAETKRKEEEEKAKKAAEDKEKHDMQERRKREKEEAERARKERDEQFMRRQREIKAIERALQSLQAVVARFKPGDNYEAALTELRSIASEAAKRIGKGEGGFVYMCQPPPPHEEGVPVPELECAYSADAAHVPGARLARGEGPAAKHLAPLFAAIDTGKAVQATEQEDGEGGKGLVFATPIRVPGSKEVLGVLGGYFLARPTSAGAGPGSAPSAAPTPAGSPAPSPHPAPGGGPAALEKEDVQRLQQLGEQLGLCLAGLAQTHSEGKRTLAVQAVKELVMKKAAPGIMYPAFMEVVRPFCPNATAMWVAAQDHPFQLRLLAADDGAKGVLGLEAGQTSRRPRPGAAGQAPPPSEFDAMEQGKYTLTPELEALEECAYFGQPPRGAVMVVPLADASGKARGSVGAVAVYKDGEPFGEAEVDMILTLAEQLGPAVEDPVGGIVKSVEAYIADNEGHGQLHPLHRLVIDALLAHTTAAAAYVAVLDPAQNCLQYVAAGPEEQDALMVGQVLPAGSGVSWRAVGAAKPGTPPQVLHVPAARAEAGAHFFDAAGGGRDGPYACFPLVDREGEVIGLLAMDGLAADGEHGKAGFTPWDLDLFGAVAKALGPAHERAERRRRSMLVLEGTIAVLRTLVGAPVAFVFTDKVPKAEEAAEKTIVPVASGPKAARAFGYLQVDEANMGAERQHMMHLLARMLAAAFEKLASSKLNKELLFESDEQLLEFQHGDINDLVRMIVPSALLKMAREELNKELDFKTIAEIKSYASPPKAVHRVLRALFYILDFKPHDVDDWKKIRQLVSDELKPKIAAYDPSAKQKKAKFKRVDAEIKGLTSEEVREKGSVAAEKMFAWVSLIASIRKAILELRRLHGTAEDDEGEDDLADTLSSAPSEALRPATGEGVPALQPARSAAGRRPSADARGPSAENRRGSLQSAGSADK